MAMARISAGPVPVSRQHRWLAWELAKRDLLGRYRGAHFGLLWTLATPLLMLGVYLLAFGPLLKARWPGAAGWQDFALMVFAGLAVHGLFAECLARAPSLVVAQPGLATRVLFPLDLLPWPALATAVFHFAMQMLVLLVGVLLWHGGPPITALALPLVLLPFLPFLLGLLWGLGALGVYLRDINQIVAPVATAMLFLSSALMPLETLPARYRWVFELNPLTLIIDQVRRVLFLGLWPQWQALVLYMLVALVACALAYGLFCKLQPGFADVL